ncbi:unnamed protein product, partial [Prunus brigantina]
LWKSLFDVQRGLENLCSVVMASYKPVIFCNSGDPRQLRTVKHNFFLIVTQESSPLAM